jgi:hypothetical protein
MHGSIKVKLGDIFPHDKINSTVLAKKVWEESELALNLYINFLCDTEIKNTNTYNVKIIS